MSSASSYKLSDSYDLNTAPIAPKIKDAAPWEIILPKSVGIMTHIHPYKKSLEALLEVDLEIKHDKSTRLFIGDSKPKGPKTNKLENIAIWGRRAKAWQDLIAYAEDCCITQKCRDIMQFMIARKKLEVLGTLESCRISVCMSSTTGISNAATGVPPIPTGQYRDHETRARNGSPRSGQTQDNKKRG